MKTIYDNYVEDKLKQHLLYHIDIEAKLQNQINFLNESLGTFNNCGKIVEHVFNELYENGFKDELRLDCRRLKSYFDTIDIRCYESSQMYASYLGQENRNVELEFHIPRKLGYEHYEEFMFLCIHELMHGYEYKRRTKNWQAIYIQFAR